MGKLVDCDNDYNPSKKECLSILRTELNNTKLYVDMIADSMIMERIDDDSKNNQGANNIYNFINARNEGVNILSSNTSYLLKQIELSSKKQWSPKSLKLDKLMNELISTTVIPDVKSYYYLLHNSVNLSIYETYCHDTTASDSNYDILKSYSQWNNSFDTFIYHQVSNADII
jgi:hypothetical protein